jgi:hypothetical protein
MVLWASGTRVIRFQGSGLVGRSSTLLIILSFGYDLRTDPFSPKRCTNFFLGIYKAQQELEKQ